MFSILWLVNSRFAARRIALLGRYTPIQNESKNKTEQISESSRSGFLILQAESDTSINIQKRMSTIDSDEEEQIEPNTSFSKKKILQDLPKKKEKDTTETSGCSRTAI